MAEQKTVYKIAPNIALTSKGAVFIGGQVVEEKDFASKEVFEDLVKKGKIVVDDGKKKPEGKPETNGKPEKETTGKPETNGGK